MLFRSDSPDRWTREIEAFTALGATCIRVHTTGGGYSSPREHLDAALEFKQFVDRL